MFEKQNKPFKKSGGEMPHLQTICESAGKSLVDMLSTFSDPVIRETTDRLRCLSRCEEMDCFRTCLVWQEHRTRAKERYKKLFSNQEVCRVPGWYRGSEG